MPTQKIVIDLTRPPELNVPPGFDGKITTLNQNDVLCGKGCTISNYPGNIQLRSIAGRERAAYLSSTIRMEKTYICAQLVADIRSLNPPGRFLKIDRKRKCWIEIGDEAARKKVSQVLRESAYSSEESNEPGHYNQPLNFQLPVLHHFIRPTMLQSETENLQLCKNAPSTYLASETKNEMESIQTTASFGLDHYAWITRAHPAASRLLLIPDCKSTNENTVEVFDNLAAQHTLDDFSKRCSVLNWEPEDCSKVTALEIGLNPIGSTFVDLHSNKEPPCYTAPHTYVQAPESLNFSTSANDSASYRLEPFDSRTRDSDAALFLNSMPSHPRITEFAGVDYSITPFASVQYASRRSSIKSWASHTSDRYFSDFSIAGFSDILTGQENDLSNDIELMTSLNENKRPWFNASHHSEVEEYLTETEHNTFFQSDLSEASRASFVIDSSDEIFTTPEDNLSVVSYMTLDSDLFLNSCWEE